MCVETEEDNPTKDDENVTIKKAKKLIKSSKINLIPLSITQLNY